MGVRNYLIEGVSGTGKTSVCHELRRRGYRALNGDRDLAYRGDPETGEPAEPAADLEGRHRQHLWNEPTVRALIADHSHQAVFFCGGSRNVDRYLDLFDAVFVLRVDPETLVERLDRRGADEFGGTPEEKALVLRLQRTREDTPDGIPVDATAPLTAVVDTILRRCGLPSTSGATPDADGEPADVENAHSAPSPGDRIVRPDGPREEPAPCRSTPS